MYYTLFNMLRSFKRITYFNCKLFCLLIKVFTQRKWAIPFSYRIDCNSYVTRFIGDIIMCYNGALAPTTKKIQIQPIFVQPMINCLLFFPVCSSSLLLFCFMNFIFRPNSSHRAGIACNSIMWCIRNMYWGMGESVFGWSGTILCWFHRPINCGYITGKQFSYFSPYNRLWRWLWHDTKLGV